MPRHPRLFLPEATYHVYCRVARGEFVFDDDYEAVEFIDATNAAVVVFFDLESHLPMKLETHFTDKMGVRHKQEQEFSNWHVISGVRFGKVSGPPGRKIASTGRP